MKFKQKLKNIISPFVNFYINACGDVEKFSHDQIN